MSTKQQTLSCVPGVRYSIPQLLELARSAISGFDLANFTYDAARAGVVPPLSDCAIQPRRRSNTCSRNWSSEGVESMEDLAISSGNTAQQPIRQPIVPPPETFTQCHEGFARFLKKHSSPNHQRVTAGGRIVPMEQRGAPPAYSLAQHNQRDNNAMDAVRNLEEKLQAQRDYNKKPLADRGMHPSMLLPPPPMAPTSVAAVQTWAAGVPIQPITSGYGTMSPFPQYVTYPPGTTYYMPGMVDHSNPIPQSPLLTDPMSDVRPQAPNPYLGYVAPAPIWSASGGLGTTYDPMACGYNTETHQQVLDRAKAHFEDLDGQLKQIDRFRATREHDPVLANQRIAIVEQRATAKDYIAYLRNTFGLEQDQPFYSPPQNQTNWNVGAPEYVPNNGQYAQAQNGTAGSASHAARANGEVRGPSQRAQHAVSIIAPPDNKHASTHQQQNVVGPTDDEGHPVDEWGARLGDPPPDVKRHQDALMEAITKERENKTKLQATNNDMPGLSANMHDANPNMYGTNTGMNSDLDRTDANMSATNTNMYGIDSGIHRNLNGTENIQPVLYDDIPDTASISSEAREEMMANVPNHELEAAFSRQLDALRKPVGERTFVEVVHGYVIPIIGVALTRPRSADMGSFEKDYWRRTSYFSFNAMPPKSQSDKQPLQQHGDWNTNSLGGPGSAVTGGSRFKENSMQTERQVDTESSKDEDDILGDVFHNTQGGVHKSSQMFPNSRGLRSTRPATSPIPMDYSHERSDMTSMDDFPPDAMSNKGFASSSFQPVTAVGSLPSFYLDGSTDGNRRSAQAMLANAHKATSPIFRRWGPKGGI